MMTQSVKVAANGRSLERGGKQFFWLADTCWSAFTNISDDEWVSYLDYRAAQGFNVLQINALPQWDRCGSHTDLFPFPTEDGFIFDTSTILPEYFGHARSMCQAAVERGFTLALVVMWSNYVPGSWITKFNSDNIIPEERIEPIVRSICEAFNEFAPIYIISGDADFDAPEAVGRYRLVTSLVEKYAPDALKAYHIISCYDGLPQELADHADLYIYQSGHNEGKQDAPAALAESFYNRTPRRPVINSEPCYEQISYYGGAYGRFRRTEIRAALWNSLLAGASAGITYGAHGVWNWQKPNMPHNPHCASGFLPALPCQTALKLPGAADYGFAKRFFLENSITSVTPCQDVLTQYTEQIRAAKANDMLLLYVPTSTPLVLNGHWSSASAIDLATGQRAELGLHIDGSQTLVDMHLFYEDVLLVLQ